ncbi:MAG TPA: hypothetical protein VNL15_08985 [Dehalococcoidia bacterium]|nr:hypothetical protein [Dehalococcoidia bacterium]
MVSNGRGIDLQEMLEALERMRREESDNPEYQELRQHLPADWPI